MLKVAVIASLAICAYALPNGILPIGGGTSSGCRYWCKTPEGQAYCCETDVQPPSGVYTKRTGECPPVRPTCPRIFGPPKTCSNDGSCPGSEKCCYDRCLEQHVCKEPLYGPLSGGGVGFDNELGGDIDPHDEDLGGFPGVHGKPGGFGGHGKPGGFGGHRKPFLG